MFLTEIPHPLKMRSHRITSCPNQLHTIKAYRKHFHMGHSAAIFSGVQSILQPTRDLSNPARDEFQTPPHGSMLKSNLPILHICQFWFLQSINKIAYKATMKGYSQDDNTNYNYMPAKGCTLTCFSKRYKYISIGHERGGELLSSCNSKCMSLSETKQCSKLLWLM